jgi:hypothetical protein
MRHWVVGATLLAALAASTASAALRTRSLEALEQTLVAREATWAGDGTKEGARLARLCRAALREFDRKSATARSDAAHIKRIAVLVGKLPSDEALATALDAGVNDFVRELSDDLAGLDRRVGLVGDAEERKAAAVKACGKADAAVAAARAADTLALRVKLVATAAKASDSAHSIAERAFHHVPTAPVHHFEVDLTTGDYLVSDVRVSEDDTQRDVAGSLCSRCHAAAAGEVLDSVHFKLAAPTQRVLFPGGGSHGMVDRACGLPSTTALTNFTSDVNLGECAKCHVGRYAPMMEGFFQGAFAKMGVHDPAGEARKLVVGGLDCLICHAGSYRSRPAEGKLAAVAGTATPDAASPNSVGHARDARDDADFDHDGRPDLVIDVDGDGVADAPLMMDSDGDGAPDRPWPTLAQDRGLDALRSIGPTTEEKCLRCHDHARTGYKRGTLFDAAHDVHAGATHGAFQGASNRCTTCHTAHGHKFDRGHAVGGDMAAADYPAPAPGTAADPSDPHDVTCVKCHDPATLPATIHTTRHLAAIACETCHIPSGSGITYSLFGDGGQLSFGRNAAGKDTKLVVADMYVTGDAADLAADEAAYRTPPVLTWFDGGVSFLAQTLAVRGMPNAKITPFKPMANGMVFDARFFQGVTAKNAAGADYNAHSMYAFYANGANAEAFAGLGLLDMTPDRVRRTSLMDFYDPDPTVQAMALLLIFPNLVYFDKAEFGYEHYLTRRGSPFDANGDGVVDVGSGLAPDMFAAANSGLRQFQGFNGPMGFAPEYSWYPAFSAPSDLVSMKLPDGSEIKMFLKMQAAKLPAEQQPAFLAAVENYPSFSQVTLGGHGVQPKAKALGATSCLDCHGPSGVLARPVPVGRRVPVDMGPMGTLEMPVYRWKYYEVRKLVDLGLTTTSDDVVSGAANVDVDGNTTYLRESAATFVVNWIAPAMPGGWHAADDAASLAGTGLMPEDLTTAGGSWMPVLEPEVDLVPTYKVLGYAAAEIIWP